jgi:hypothetical protein
VVEQYQGCGGAYEYACRCVGEDSLGELLNEKENGMARETLTLLLYDRYDDME